VVTIPTRLYKYEPLTIQALHNLKSQVIYFGSPAAFNDPYDCALVPNVSTPTDADVKQIRDYYLDRNDLPEKARAEFQQSSVDVLRGPSLEPPDKALRKLLRSSCRDVG
jgi:hypothetical protein